LSTIKKVLFLRAFRNIPGVQFCSVHRLNLLKLAPGGHLGRFIIWTQSAFQQLDKIYGTYKSPSQVKVGFRLPRVALTNSDLGRLINSQEIQSHLRSKKSPRRFVTRKRNPLKNLGFLVRLNPYAKVERKKTIEDAKNAKKRRLELSEQREKARAARAGKKSPKEASKKEEGKQTQAKKGKDAQAYKKLFVKTLLS